MHSMDKIKSLVGDDATEEDLKFVDCYVHDKLGIFIPSMGQCLYAIKPYHTHPSYMFIIYFDPAACKNVNIEIPNNHYLSTVSSPLIKHQESAQDSHHYYCILIDKEYFESQYLLYASSVPEFNFLQFPLCHDILKTLNIFTFEAGKEMKNSNITLTAQSTIITHWLIRSILQENYDMRAITSNYVISRTQHYIEQHLDESITVKTLALSANMSITHFNRIFKKELGMTPIDYLIDARITRAKNLLRRLDHSITDISLKCGFNSNAHFSSTFQKKVGITPTEYRNSYQY
ncbi:helix-turn-helix domain-containing protein [Anaerosporobacter sp.]